MMQEYPEADTKKGNTQMILFARGCFFHTADYNVLLRKGGFLMLCSPLSDLPTLKRK